MEAVSRRLGVLTNERGGPVGGEEQPAKQSYLTDSGCH